MRSIGRESKDGVIHWSAMRPRKTEPRGASTKKARTDVAALCKATGKKVKKMQFCFWDQGRVLRDSKYYRDPVCGPCLCRGLFKTHFVRPFIWHLWLRLDCQRRHCQGKPTTLIVTCLRWVHLCPYAFHAQASCRIFNPDIFYCVFLLLYSVETPCIHGAHHKSKSISPRVYSDQS